MLREKRVNYAIGLFFCILIFGFMAAPFLGDATCYKMLDLFSLMKLLNQSYPLITAIYIFLILTLIAVSLTATLAIIGFVLKCTKYRQSKAENIVSVIYSSMLFIVIATTIVMLSLSLKYLIDAELGIRYGFIVLFVLVYILPYFCATKFNLSFAILMLVLITYVGIIFYVLHEKVFKPNYQKQQPQNEPEQNSF